MILSNRIGFFSKLFAIIISLLIFIQPLAAQEPDTDKDKKVDYSQVCDQAKKDAADDEGSALGYGAGGFLCGIFGWLFAELSSPRAPSAKFIGKDATYAKAYSSCYEKKAKSIRRTSACVGWAIGSTLSLVLIYGGQ
ncbi:MAG: hypothetical protein V1779_16675 [bacterium]